MRRQAVNIFLKIIKVLHGKSVAHTLKKTCKIAVVHISAKINEFLDNILSMNTIAWNLSDHGVL